MQMDNDVENAEKTKEVFVPISTENMNNVKDVCDNESDVKDAVVKDDIHRAEKREHLEINIPYRPTSLQLESVLEYTSKIKAFLGLADGSNSPILDLPSAISCDSIPKIAAEIPNTPNVSEESIPKISEVKASNDNIIPDKNTEEIINQTDEENLSDSNSVHQNCDKIMPKSQHIPDILDVTSESETFDSLERFPDILESSKFENPEMTESFNEALSDISEEKLEGNFSNADNISLDSSDIARNDLPETNYQDCPEYTKKSGNSDEEVSIIKNINSRENVNIDINLCNLQVDEKVELQNDLRANHVYYINNEKPVSFENSAGESSSSGENNNYIISPYQNMSLIKNNFDINSEPGCSNPTFENEMNYNELDEEKPYQITHIEEGLRQAEKSPFEKEKKLKHDTDSEEISSENHAGNKQRHLEGIRRLSTEVVNSILQSAADQVEVIIRERTSIVEANESSNEAENSTEVSKDDLTHLTEQTQNNKSSEEIKEPYSGKAPKENSEVQQSFSGRPENKIDVITRTIIITDDTPIEYDPETQCGLGSFKPHYLQPFARAEVYLVLYSLIGIFHGSYYTYLVGVLSTLEKRFEFKSKTSGVIMILDELTPLFLGVFVGHYGGKAHRPRLVSFGMFMSAFCCFASALPYFLYGTATHLTSVSVHNRTSSDMCSGMQYEDCDSDDRPSSITAILLLMLGSFLKGFGNLAYYAIGLAYLDDNSKKKNTPIYFGVAFALRLLGPMVGFLMSSAFLKYYENPFDDPGFGPEDPRWIGGWWMGFVLQGVLLLIFAGPLALFPRVLPGHKSASHKMEDISTSFFEGLSDALRRLARNPLYIFINLNTIFTIYGNFGYYINSPKYMENQFRLSASTASLVAGPPGLAALMISTVVGGFLIWKFKPSAKFLAGGFIILEIISALGYLLLMIPQCDTVDMRNFGVREESLILEDNCNVNCNCSTISFAPICGPDGTTSYFSPCYAGCMYKEDEAYYDCTCMKDFKEDDVARKGFCSPTNCWFQTIGYIITLPILQLIINILRVAHTMIMLRSIKPEDKSIALGVYEAIISTIGFIPYPIVFGALVDSTCLVWEQKCGETGNCWFYDIQKFNYYIHGTSALFCGISILPLAGIFFLINRIQDLYEDSNCETIELKHNPTKNANTES